MRKVQVERWRIVDDDLWERAHSRRVDVAGRTLRFASGRISGRPPKHAPKNLLAGLAMCAVCGGGMVVDDALTPLRSRRSFSAVQRRAFCFLDFLWEQSRWLPSRNAPTR